MLLALILGILGLGTAVIIMGMYISFEKRKHLDKTAGKKQIEELRKRVKELEDQNLLQAETVEDLEKDLDFYKKLINDKQK